MIKTGKSKFQFGGLILWITKDSGPVPVEWDGYYILSGILNSSAIFEVWEQPVNMVYRKRGR